MGEGYSGTSDGRRTSGTFSIFAWLNSVLTKGNIIDAQAALRFEIHATLHPERYAAAGFTGGYSYAVPKPESFNLKNISFSGKNFTVRQLLNTIVRQNGNALWIVKLVPSKMVKGEPYFAPGSSPETARRDFYWQILPFEAAR